MYFYLSSLSFPDLCFSTNVTPKVLENFLSAKKTIFYVGCLVQGYTAFAMVLIEHCMLAAMAYDCYMAICNPLPYSKQDVCAWSLSLMSMASSSVRWKSYRLIASPVVPMKSTISTVLSLL